MTFDVCVNPEETWHHWLVNLPTSPVYCSHCTLGNPKSHFSTVLIIHTSHYFYVISKKTNCCPLPTTPDGWLVGWLEFNVPFQHKYGYVRDDPPHLKKCHRTTLWNAELFHLTEGNVAFHHALLKFSSCRNNTLPQLVRIADWYSIHAPLQQPNSAVPTSSSLSLERKSTDITETCCWCTTAIRSIAGDVFAFQQDNAPAHRARDTVELFLRSETP